MLNVYEAFIKVQCVTVCIYVYSAVCDSEHITAGACELSESRAGQRNLLLIKTEMFFILICSTRRAPSGVKNIFSITKVC